MPSLRQKVTTYFRQLSFIADSRDVPSKSLHKSHGDDGNFVCKYLEGQITRQFTSGPEICHGQSPSDLPDLQLNTQPKGTNLVSAACTGPDEGLTGIKRSKLHLCAKIDDDDIDFIDSNKTENEESRIVDQLQTNRVQLNNSINNNHKYVKANHNGKQNGSGEPEETTNVNQSRSDQNANRLGTSSTSGLKTGNQRRNSRGNMNLNASTTNPTISTSSTATSTTSTPNNLKRLERRTSTTIVVSMITPMAANPDKMFSPTITKVSQTDSNAAINDQNNRNLLNTTNIDRCSYRGVKNNKNNNNNNNYKTSISSMKHTFSATKDQIPIILNTTSGNNTTNERLTKTTTILSSIPSAIKNVDQSSKSNSSNLNCSGSIAGVSDWQMSSDYAYGISVSLYENNMLMKEPMGNPIADCYGLVVRGDVALMALADGVNWGDGARLAARSAVHGCLDYLDCAIFSKEQQLNHTKKTDNDDLLGVSSTREVFTVLLQSLWEGHGCILEVGGALTTLTIAVVLPLNCLSPTDKVSNDNSQYVVCACNVGDSLGYVYSKKHGVREFTVASHDINSMRDMRDALGAIGPADGNKPELSNLTFSMTMVEKGDIVFLTSDGVSDNFDPVVGKFAEAWTPEIVGNNCNGGSSLRLANGSVLAPKRQNKSSSSLHNRLLTTATTPNYNNNYHQPLRLPRLKPSSTSIGNTNNTNITTPSSVPQFIRPKFMRSHTVIEPRQKTRFQTPSAFQQMEQHSFSVQSPRIPRSSNGLPLVTGPQRHALTLYRLEDLLSYGINGKFSPCSSARRLCHLLIEFVRMITSARRKTLEQRELFYKLIPSTTVSPATTGDGQKREIELSRLQHRAARRRVIESPAFTALPGKLDHATVVAFNVGEEIESSPKKIKCSDLNLSDGLILPSTTLHATEFNESTIF